MNTVYALLAERATTADDALTPALLTRGVTGADLEQASERAALDAWLDGPMGQDAAAEAALVRWLGASA